MATGKRRTKAKRATRKAKSTRSKSAVRAHKATAKRATRRPAPARKSARSKRASAGARPAQAARKATTKRPASQAARSSAPKSAAKGARSAAGSRQSSRRPLNAEAKKQIAGEHLRELLEQKKQRETQVPAWQQIEHHDRPPRTTDTQPPAPPAHPGIEPEGDLAEGSVVDPKLPGNR